jgi:hypothetical protein
MAKSTPIAVIKQQQQQNPEIHEDQSDDVVQDVLSSLNNEHFQQQQQQQQAPASAPLYADLVADANSHPYAGAEAAAVPGHVQPFSIGPLTTDLKLAAICMAVFVAVTQIPLEKIIYSYIALDKLPFSEVLVKGAIAGALFYFLTRLIT